MKPGGGNWTHFRDLSNACCLIGLQLFFLPEATTNLAAIPKRKSIFEGKDLIIVIAAAARPPIQLPTHNYSTDTQWRPSQPRLAHLRAQQQQQQQQGPELPRSDASAAPPSAPTRPARPTSRPSRASAPPPRCPTSATTPPRLAPTRT